MPAVVILEMALQIVKRIVLSNERDFLRQVFVQTLSAFCEGPAARIDR
jgi:hypothetical protein